MKRVVDSPTVPNGQPDAPTPVVSPTEIAADPYQQEIKQEIKEEEMLPGPVDMKEPFLDSTQPMSTPREDPLVQPPECSATSAQDGVLMGKRSPVTHTGESPPRKDHRTAGE